MKIKRYLLFLLLLVPVCVQGQFIVRVYLANANHYDFVLSEKPKIMYSENKVTFVCNDETFEYDVKDIQKVKIEDSATGVEQIVMNSNIPCVTSVYDVNGRKVMVVSEEKACNSKIMLSSLPKGIYIVKHGETTYKIVKK